MSMVRVRELLSMGFFVLIKVMLEMVWWRMIGINFFFMKVMMWLKRLGCLNL